MGQLRKNWFEMTAVPVRMTIQWLVPLGKTRSLTEALHSLMVTARAQPGCLGCSVSTNVGERGTVRYSEDWGSESALREQFDTDRFRHLVALVESATEAPLVEFELPSGSRGLEYMREAAGR
jgi:quinol monooxygenase YgiN